jgi:tetratricopeptide (TPR) repeat protein
MKYSHRLVLIVSTISVFCLSAKAQNLESANDLVKQGMALHNQHKYTEAADKFTEALKADTANAYAHYQFAFSLYAQKKPDEAIPHLQKATVSENTNISAGAYALLAGIYDEANDSKKAISMYREVIKVNPNYPQVYYNFGLTYFRNQQYQAAEACAIEAIARSPKHAGSHRLYALVNFHLNKRANALLGLCSFLMLEPTGVRATEAYANIQHIMQGGVLTAETKKDTTMAIATADEKEMKTLNLGIQLATGSAKTKNLTGADLLEYQLKNIFAFAGDVSQKKTDKSFFDNFFVVYFYKLSQSNHMPAFAHTIALINDPKESVWIQTHQAEINTLADWVKATEREL